MPEVPEVPRDILRDAMGKGVSSGFRRALFHPVQQGRTQAIVPIEKVLEIGQFVRVMLPAAA
jgi:hypothetical protein